MLQFCRFKWFTKLNLYRRTYNFSIINIIYFSIKSSVVFPSCACDYALLVGWFITNYMFLSEIELGAKCVVDMEGSQTFLFNHAYGVREGLLICYDLISM